MDSFFPFLNVAVSSPRYQTLPLSSWANQSKVSSMMRPSTRAVSRTTLAVTPFAIFLVWSVTVTLIMAVVPSPSTPR